MTTVKRHIRGKSVVRRHNRRTHRINRMGFYRTNDKSRTVEEYPTRDKEGIVTVHRITNDSGSIYKTSTKDPLLTFVLGVNPGKNGAGRVRVEFEKELKKKMIGMKPLSKVGPNEKKTRIENRII